MKYSIRTRLTLLISLVYVSVFFFLLAAGVLAVYFGLEADLDKKLKTERDWSSALFKQEYTDLLLADGYERGELTDELIEDINEVYGYKKQFVIFALETKAGRRVYSGGGIKNIRTLLPEKFLSQKDGYYSRRLESKWYRILVSKEDWGTLVVGIENQAFFQVANEFKGILLIGVPLTLILVLLGGRFLAGRAMKPIAAAAETTEKITLNNLSERLPEYAGRDEFGKLVSTLNLMIARLERGVKRVQQFTQDAAHELRTPLTVVRGELELAYQHKDMPDEIRSALQMALDHAIAMDQIVENLMLLAQSDTGKYPMQQKTFRLDALVKDVVHDMKTLVDGRPVEIRFTRCDEVQFNGDKQLMQRVLLNLSDNALKYTERGKIEFTLQSQNDEIDLVISDTGKGIPEEDLPHIFDRFYRVDKARTRTTGGSGLGLAICKWIVEAHDGTIRVESDGSSGTQVTITLPKIRETSTR